MLFWHGMRLFGRTMSKKNRALIPLLAMLRNLVRASIQMSSILVTSLPSRPANLPDYCDPFWR
jgi:hypothetical protein